MKIAVSRFILLDDQQSAARMKRPEVYHLSIVVNGVFFCEIVP